MGTDNNGWKGEKGKREGGRGRGGIRGLAGVEVARSVCLLLI